MNKKSKVYILLISFIVILSSCSFDIDKKINENDNGSIVVRTINRNVPSVEPLTYKATISSIDGSYSKTIEVQEGNPIIFDKITNNTYKITVTTSLGFYDLFGEVQLPYEVNTDPDLLEINITLEKKAVKGQFGIQFNTVKLYDNTYFNVTVKDKEQKIVWEQKDTPSSSIIENKYVIPVYLPEDEYYISLTGGNTDKETYSVNNNSLGTIKKETVTYYEVSAISYDNVSYVKSGSVNGDGSRSKPFNSIKSALEVIGENQKVVTLSLLGDITEGEAIPEINRPLKLTIIGSPESMTGSATITASNGLFNFNNPSSHLTLRNIKLDANNTPINITAGTVLLDTDTTLSAAQDVITLGPNGRVEINDNASVTNGKINLGTNGKVFALSYLTSQRNFMLKGEGLKAGTQVLFTGKDTSYGILSQIYSKFLYEVNGIPYFLDENGAITSSSHSTNCIQDALRIIKNFSLGSEPSLGLTVNIKEDSELAELGRALRSIPLSKSVNLTINSANGFNTISSSINSDGNGIQTLASLTIGNGITKIGRDSFKNCSKLQTVHFPDSLLTIEDNCFDECRSIQTLELPPNLLEVGINNFEGNIQVITFKASSDTIWEVSNTKERFNCSKNAGVSNMESFVNNKNYKITKILKGSDIASLFSIGINDNLILSVDLDGNTSSLSIPSSYKGELTLNIVGKSINDSAFKNCNSLKHLNIASSVSQIGNGILEGVMDVAVVIDKGNESYKVANNCIMTTSEAKIVQAINSSSVSSITIPKNTIQIQAKAFSGSNLSNVTFSDSKAWFTDNNLSLTPSSSSSNATKLKTDFATNIVAKVFTVDEAKVYLPTVASGEVIHLAVNAKPNNVEQLGDPIGKCPGKVELNLLPSTELTSIPYSCLSYNSSIVKLFLPDCLKEIPNRAFKNTAITEVRLPSALVSIGDCAFEESKLTSIELPSTLKAIHSNAFWGTKIKEFHIPSSVTYIAYLAFPFDNQQKVTQNDPKIYFEDTLPFKGLKDGIIYPKLNQDTIDPVKKYLYSISNSPITKAISYDEAISILTNNEYPAGAIPDGYGDIRGGNIVVSGKNLTQTQLENLFTKAKTYNPNSSQPPDKFQSFELCLGILYGEGTPYSYLSIPDNAFQNVSTIDRICIPKNVNKIGKNAFNNTGIYTSSDDRVFDFEDLTKKWKNEVSGATISLTTATATDILAFFTVSDASFSIVP